MRAAISIVIVAAFAAPTWAQPHADSDLARVQEAIANDRPADAYELGTQLVARRPEDLLLRGLLATAAIGTLRYDEAWQHVEKGLALEPESSQLLSVRAILALLRDDEAGARADAERARRLGVPAETFWMIDVVGAARDRLERRGTAMPSGSAAAFVDELIERLSELRPPGELARAFDPEIWSNAKVKARDTVMHVLHAEVGTILRIERDTGLRSGGWIVTPEVRHEGDRVWVHVDAPFELAFTTDVRRQYAAALAGDTSAREVLDRELLTALDSLPPSDRAGVLDGLVGKRLRTFFSFELELKGNGGDWHITDVVRDGVSYRATLREREAAVVRIGGKPGRARVRLVGAVFLLLGMIGGIVWLVRRHGSGRSLGGRR